MTIYEPQTTTIPWKPEDARALAEFHGHHGRLARGTKKCPECGGKCGHETVDDDGEVTSYRDCTTCGAAGEVPAAPGEAG